MAGWPPCSTAMAGVVTGGFGRPAAATAWTRMVPVAVGAAPKASV